MKQHNVFQEYIYVLCIVDIKAIFVHSGFWTDEDVYS